MGKTLVGHLWLDITNVMVSKCFKTEKIQFPVAVHGSKTSVLKFKYCLSSMQGSRSAHSLEFFKKFGNLQSSIPDLEKV